jgi:DNA-binding NtrC family response regulator
VEIVGKKPSVLIVDDLEEERAALGDALSASGFSVGTASDGVGALEELSLHDFDVVVADLRMPKVDGMVLLKEVRDRYDSLPVVLMSGYGTVETAVEAMKMGAWDFVVKPFQVRILESVLRRAVQLTVSSSKPVRSEDAGRAIITKNEPMIRLLELVSRVADSRAPVFIQGESGTGKELFARFVHRQSGRRSRPFVALNCAALPEGLLESELFGHEKGAFTGAISRKPGKFELADGGTILLDEISEMSVHLQAKLLRVLQESEVDPVGGRQPVPVDVRVIATTNRDIEAAVEAEKFRADLYYRLNVVPIKVPALRERRDDIRLLAEHFVKKYNKIDGRHVAGLSDEAVRMLGGMAWPGNVRELENVIERAVLLCRGERIEPHDLSWGDEKPPAQGEPMAVPAGSLREMEREMIRRALDETNGNRTHAAEILGISVRTLRNKLNEYRQKMEAF